MSEPSLGELLTAAQFDELRCEARLGSLRRMYGDVQHEIALASANLQRAQIDRRGNLEQKSEENYQEQQQRTNELEAQLAKLKQSIEECINQKAALLRKIRQLQRTLHLNKALGALYLPGVLNQCGRAGMRARDQTIPGAA